MTWTRKILSIALLGAAAALPTAEAGWIDMSSSVYQAEKNSDRHPPALTQAVVVREDAPDALVCGAYFNTLRQKNRGRVSTSVEVLRGGETVAALSFVRGVRKNTSIHCRSVGGLLAGDVVLFDFRLEGMPRLKRKAERLDYVEINGVVSTAGEPEIDRLGLTPFEGGGWIHSASSVFVAERKKGRQPNRVDRTFFVPRNALAPEICIAYLNTSEKRGRGRVKTKVLIHHASGVLETATFAGGVERNTYVKCKPVAPLFAGDMVEFRFELRGMPRLKMADDGAQIADLSGAVSMVGEPVFQNPPPAEELPPRSIPPPELPPPDENPPPSPSPSPPGPSPSPSPGGGPLSAADESAAYKLLIANRSTQLQRPSRNSPGHWVAVGPRSRAEPCGCRVDLDTAGVGNTIASAVADYERKMGSLGSGGGLSAADRNALAWYSAMSSSGGPTAIRRDGGGGYHGEYYRQGRGAHHRGGFGSIASVVSWFQSQGL